MTSASTFVSVVANVHADTDVMVPFVRDTIAVLAEHYENYELVLVDDGSDVTALKPLLDELRGIRILRLSRHFGPDVALTAGLETAIGDWIVTLSPYTDPPSLVPTLIERAQSGDGVICGVAPTSNQRLIARWFYALSARLLDVVIVPHSTQLRVFSRQALNAIVRIKDKHRYLEVFAPFIGFGVEHYTYEPVRPHPVPPAMSAIARAADLVVTNSLRPLRLVAALGVIAAGLDVAYVGYVFLIALFKDSVAEGWITLSLQNAGMFLLMFIMLSVLAEYVGRLLYEARDRPLYFVREELVSTALIREEMRNVVSE